MCLRSIFTLLNSTCHLRGLDFVTRSGVACSVTVAHARPASVPVGPPSLTDIPIVHSGASSSSKSLHTAPLNNLTVTRVFAGDNCGIFSSGRDLFSANNLNKMDDDQAKTL